ncbi:transporter [Octadecabacter sp. SW4]|uniref:outer membrane protein transport protein n=1 Tax=Octadecabacter sp. SW4 TaxID=2602067 RepID=UPI0011C207D2|nr:outer membrane protein transport protein [Octadecabacter sp. SW4]QEE35620.1 transporter [Octadecabacter sp. SW4]
MNKFMTAGAALLATTTMATAGGIDRSGQPITAIFEDGDYVELTFGMVSPSISGTAFGQASGNIGVDYTQIGFALKTDLSDALSLAVILDQPFGASVSYDDPGYALAGSSAKVESLGTTVIGRYRINENFSVHAGVRHVTASGEYTGITSAPLPAGAYSSVYSPDSATGYVIGAAYERPDIAMRIALTYSSALDFSLDGSAGDLTANMPESVNLDFQTGIAADTLLFGSIRYAAWDGVTLTDSTPPVGDIVSYTDDVITYNVGVGRRFSDNFAASVSIGHERSTGTPTGNLGPTDGYTSLQLGGAYDLGNGLEISGGLRYVWIGDAVTVPPIGGVFNDNTAVAVGLKMAYNF